MAVAWGDESIRQRGVPEPMYLMGACLCDANEDEVRKLLAQVKPKGALKLHWRDMRKPLCRKSIGVVEGMGLSHIVVATVPMTDWTTTERARRKCLEQLLPVLENEYGVERFVLESRNKGKDKKDIQLVDALRSRMFIDKIRVDLVPGSSDARLWLPDQLLGAYGDSKAGVDDYNAFLASVRTILVPSD